MSRLLAVLIVIAVALVFTATPDGSYAAGKKSVYVKSIETSAGSLSPKFSESKTVYTVSLAASQSDEVKISFFKAGNATTKSKTKTTKTEVRVKSKVGDAKWSGYSKNAKLAKTLSVGQGEVANVKFMVSVKTTTKTVSKSGNTHTRTSTKTRTYTVKVKRGGTADKPDEATIPENPDNTADPPARNGVKHTLTVINGTGSGVYETGELVTITPTVPEGQRVTRVDYSFPTKTPSRDPRGTSYGFSIYMPDSNLTVTITFGPDTTYT
jgi:hypothetical protein